MSTAKVSTSAPVGHTTTTMVKLGNMGASPASASVVGVSDSANVGTSTDQYLPNAHVPMEENALSMMDEAPILPLGAAVEASAVMETRLKFSDSVEPYVSLHEAGQQIESYEKTMEVFETPLKKRTQGFG